MLNVYVTLSCILTLTIFFIGKNFVLNSIDPLFTHDPEYSACSKNTFDVLFPVTGINDKCTRRMANLLIVMLKCFNCRNCLRYFLRYFKDFFIRYLYLDE